MMYQFKASEQFKMTCDAICSVLIGYQASAIAELTGEHNVHYHCMVEIKDILDKDKFLNRFRKYTKLLGRKTCTQVVYEDSYRKYMKKDLEETRLILHDPILRDSFGIFAMAQFPPPMNI